MILVSFFSEDNVLSDEIKICYIFEYQSNENRAFCFFFGGIADWDWGKIILYQVLRKFINKNLSKVIDYNVEI